MNKIQKSWLITPVTRTRSLYSTSPAFSDISIFDQNFDFLFFIKQKLLKPQILDLDFKQFLRVKEKGIE